MVEIPAAAQHTDLLRERGATTKVVLGAWRGGATKVSAQILAALRASGDAGSNAIESSSQMERHRLRRFRPHLPPAALTTRLAGFLPRAVKISARLDQGNRRAATGETLNMAGKEIRIKPKDDACVRYRLFIS